MGQGSLDHESRNVKFSIPEDGLTDKMVVANSDVVDDVSGATFPTPLSRAALSSVIAQRRGSATLRISEKAAEMRAEGKDAWRINCCQFPSMCVYTCVYIYVFVASMCVYICIYIYVYVCECTTIFPFCLVAWRCLSSPKDDM